MARAYDFLSASLPTVGVIDPGVVVNVASSVIDFASQIFGKDAVPDYPIKSGNTYNSLKASIIEWVGVVAPKGIFEPAPPASVEAARVMLAKAIKRKAEETALGHGTGDGVGWDTLQMLYAETITSLEAFIRQGGINYTAGSQYPQTTLPGQTSPYPMQQGNFLTNTGLLGLPNWVTLGGAAAAIYFMTRKKRRR